MSMIPSLPTGLSKILLALARQPGNPICDRGIGYEIIAPLDLAGHIDADLWRANADLCKATRFHRNEEEQFGHLVRRSDGVWAVCYARGGGDEEGACHFDDEQAFLPGGCITITEKGAERLYQVVSAHVV
jgi:hypothetical protein